MRLRFVLSWLGPGLLLALAAGAAVWLVRDFESEPDTEFPAVERATFSPYPPRAYRIAEPGDTLDRAALYLGALAVGLGLSRFLEALRRRERPALWPTAIAIGLGTAFHSSLVDPNPTGWPGPTIGSFRVMSIEPALAIGLVIGLVFLGNLALARSGVRALCRAARERRSLGLLFVAFVLAGLGLAEPPTTGPPGYWPRWLIIGGLLAFDYALLRLLRLEETGTRARLARAVLVLVVTLGLSVSGRALIVHQRPIERLKEVVPGKLFICALPTPEGLELAHERHRFRAIINLFPEDTPMRSPYYEEELRFAREHGIQYLGCPTDPRESEAFLNQTLALASSPDAWPVLVHCHACRDRTPAWLAVYRFVVEGWPLLDAMREIEQHRGHRPKASVTLMLNEVLPRLAPARAALDPTAEALRRSAGGIRFRRREPRATISHLADETLRRP